METALIPCLRRYPYVTRMAIDLFNAGRLPNVRRLEVEDSYGYVTRLEYRTGSSRITYGNDVGINAGSSCQLAKDKGFTKTFLRKLGVECPGGEEFVLPWWQEVVSQNRHIASSLIRGTDAAYSYVESEIGYPIYVKPVSGSKGGDVFFVNHHDLLREIFDEYERKRVKVALIERPVSMPDYRIVTLDGELISAYQRSPLSVVGDGCLTISQLITRRQREFEDSGRDTRIAEDDPRIKHFLSSTGRTLDDVVAQGEVVPLLAISNLSAGGASVDVTAQLNPRWTELTARVAAAFGLRLCGLDLACEDISSATANYAVIEVNATPGLDHYAMSGPEQDQLVQELYARVLNALP